jgi:hypothetical protein
VDAGAFLYPKFCVSRISPTLEGFRASFRRPSLTLAEIIWRWCIGITTCALLAFGFLEYLDTLPVTEGELLLLRSRHPVLMGRAIAHILRGSLNRVVAAGLVAAMALIALWVLAASLGRSAIVGALLQYFASRRDAPGVSTAFDSAARSGSLRVLLRLNFLRVAVALATILGFVGAATLGGLVSTPAHPRIGLGFVIFVPVAALVCLLGWVLNWFLSLTAVFGVRDGGATLNALTAAGAFCLRNIRPVLAVSAWTGLAHLALFLVATSVVSMPLAFIAVAQGRLILIVVLLLSLAYFAVADWLYMARLAGYVCIAVLPEQLLAPVSPAPLPASSGQIAIQPNIQASVDRDELILSDVPLAGS